MHLIIFSCQSQFKISDMDYVDDEHFNIQRFLDDEVDLHAEPKYVINLKEYLKQDLPVLSSLPPLTMKLVSSVGRLQVHRENKKVPIKKKIFFDNLSSSSTSKSEICDKLLLGQVQINASDCYSDALMNPKGSSSEKLSSIERESSDDVGSFEFVADSLCGMHDVAGADVNKKDVGKDALSWYACKLKNIPAERNCLDILENFLLSFGSVRNLKQNSDNMDFWIGTDLDYDSLCCCLNNINDLPVEDLFDEGQGNLEIQIGKKL